MGLTLEDVNKIKETNQMSGDGLSRQVYLYEDIALKITKEKNPHTLLPGNVYNISQTLTEVMLLTDVLLKSIRMMKMNI